MTLRSFFVILGVMTMLPPAIFLVLFQPPKERLRSIAFSMRLLALTLLTVGIRIVVGSLTKLERPIVFANWLDKWTTLASVVFCAAASCVFLASYLQSREW